MHSNILDNIQWCQSLKSCSTPTFTCAVPDALNQGLLNKVSHLNSMPHHIYVNDKIYLDNISRLHVEQATATSIEAIFILLGPSALDHRQDPISFDKLEEMVIGPINLILRHIIDTH